MDVLDLAKLGGGTVLAGAASWWIVHSLVSIRDIRAGHEHLNGRFDAIKKTLDDDNNNTA